MEAGLNKRRGRPPKVGTTGPRGGKGSAMTTRITGETRAALEAEAERTGRSIGQVAEAWLEEARTGRAGFQRFGGLQVAALLERMGEAERFIVERLDYPPGSDGWNRLWRTLAEKLVDRLPVTPPTDEEWEVAQAKDILDNLPAAASAKDRAAAELRLKVAEAGLRAYEQKLAADLGKALAALGLAE